MGKLLAALPSKLCASQCSICPLELPPVTAVQGFPLEGLDLSKWDSTKLVKINPAFSVKEVQMVKSLHTELK